MTCPFCQKSFLPTRDAWQRTSVIQRFCSSSCRYKSWCKLNPDKEQATRLKSKLKHRRQRLAYGKRYYQLHKEEIRINLLTWRRRNKARVVQQVINRRNQVKNAEGSHTLEEWESLKKKYHQHCAYCNKKRFLTRDHIIPISKGGTNHIWNIQPFCRPCNSRKFNHI